MRRPEPEVAGPTPALQRVETLIETVPRRPRRVQTVAESDEREAARHRRREEERRFPTGLEEFDRARSRRTGAGRGHPAGRRSGHRQVDAAPAGDGRDRRREKGALRHGRGIGRAGGAPRAAARSHQCAGIDAGRGAARSDRRGDRGGSARSRGDRLDPDRVHGSSRVRAGQRGAGARMRGATHEAREGAPHRRDLRRARDEGGRDRRAACSRSSTPSFTEGDTTRASGWCARSRTASARRTSSGCSR